MGDTVFAPSHTHVGFTVAYGVLTFAIGYLANHGGWWWGCFDGVGKPTPIIGSIDNYYRSIDQPAAVTWQCVGVDVLKVTAGLTMAHSLLVLLSAGIELLVMSTSAAVPVSGNPQRNRTILTAAVVAHTVFVVVLIVITVGEALCVHEFSQCAAREIRLAQWYRSVVAPFYNNQHGIATTAADEVNFGKCAAHAIGRPASQWLTAIGFAANHRQGALQPHINMWFCDRRLSSGSWATTCLSSAIDTNACLANCVAYYCAMLLVVQIYFTGRVALIYVAANRDKSDNVADAAL